MTQPTYQSITALAWVGLGYSDDLYQAYSQAIIAKLTMSQFVNQAESQLDQLFQQTENMASTQFMTPNGKTQTTKSMTPNGKNCNFPIPKTNDGFSNNLWLLNFYTTAMATATSKSLSIVQQKASLAQTDYGADSSSLGTLNSEFSNMSQILNQIVSSFTQGQNTILQGSTYIAGPNQKLSQGLG
jgi:hypothetical protein